MARNGNGTYDLPAGNPVVTATTISSTWANNTLSDIATALTGSIAKDGQTTPTANLPMGTYKHTGVAVASALTDYARADQVQNSSLSYLSTVAGVDTITATATPTPAAYATGQTFRFISAGANTGAATLNISSLGAKSITKRGATALDAGDIPSGAVIEVMFDGTQFQIVNIIDKATLKTYFDTLYATVTSGTNTNITRMNGSGNGVAFGTSPTSRNNCSVQTGNSIGFPGVQNASTDPNALDDYEEGTFTPSITFATPGDLSVAYTTQVGEYTKIGQDVRVSVNLLTSSFTHTTASGNLYLTGHPFTAKTLAGQVSFGSGSWQGVTKANYTQMAASLSSNNTIATLNASGSSQSISSVSTADMPTGGTVSVRYTMNYPAA